MYSMINTRSLNVYFLTVTDSFARGHKKYSRIFYLVLMFQRKILTFRY